MKGLADRLSQPAIGTDQLARRDALRSGTVRIIRYRYRGGKIATPWNTEAMQAQAAAFRQATDERTDLDHLQRTLVG